MTPKDESLAAKVRSFLAANPTRIFPKSQIASAVGVDGFDTSEVRSLDYVLRAMRRTGAVEFHPIAGWSNAVAGIKDEAGQP